MKRHRHAASSSWCPEYGKTEEHFIRKELSVALLQEYRLFYPPGDSAPGCCTKRRRSIVVHGHIVTARDAREVVKAIDRLREAARRPDTRGEVTP